MSEETEKSKIIIKGLQISRDSTLASILGKKINGIIGSYSTVNKNNIDSLEFGNIPSGKIEAAREAVENHLTETDSEYIILADGYAGSDMGRSFSDQILPEGNDIISGRSVKISAKSGYQITSEEHRVVQDVCNKYGGERKAAVSENEAGRQKREGFTVSNIPEENYEDFIRLAERRLGNNFDVIYDDNNARVARELIL